MVNNSRMPSSKIRKRPRTGEETDALEEAQQQHHHHHRKTEDSTLGIDDGDEDAEEARIRDLVFGKEEACLFDSFGKEGDDNEAAPVSEPVQMAFFEDRNGDATLEALTDGRGLQGGVETGIGEEQGQKEAAWEDEDDAVLKVDISGKNRLKKLRVTEDETDLTGPEFEKRLRNRFTSSNVTVDWVKAAEEAKSMSRKQKNANSLIEGTGVVTYGAEDETEEGYDEEMFRDSKAFKGKSGGVLEPGYLDIARCKDANQHDPAKAVVRAVSFHPSGEILLTGGFDKTLRLFQVDGVNNHKIHSIFFEDMPITNASFTGTDQAVITGRRPFFYWYDVNSGKVQKVPRVFSSGRVEKRMETFAASPDGRWLAFLGMGGYIIIVSNKNKQWVSDFKLNCKEATAVAFSQDSLYVLASGTDGNVFKFDLRSRRCVQRFFNEGGTKTTSLATSPSVVNRLTVVGSDSGVVNVYSDDAFQCGKRVVRPTPLKALMSLTTPATTAKFSPDGQILAIASSEKRDGLKMIHTASCTPFTNWPTERTPVRYPFAMDFSPGGGFFALGNDRGCVMLYRLRHFTQA